MRMHNSELLLALLLPWLDRWFTVLHSGTQAGICVPLGQPIKSVLVIYVRNVCESFVGQGSQSLKVEVLDS